MLPHRRRELHVAFEIGAASATLAVAIMAHSGAFFQCPLLGIKIKPFMCFLQEQQRFGKHSLRLLNASLLIHSSSENLFLPCVWQALHYLAVMHSAQILCIAVRSRRVPAKSPFGLPVSAPHRPHSRTPFSKHSMHFNADW